MKWDKLVKPIGLVADITTIVSCFIIVTRGLDIPVSHQFQEFVGIEEKWWFIIFIASIITVLLIEIIKREEKKKKKR